jgi:hypothetical protein
MARKVPVPEIPPVPSRQSGRAAIGPRLPPKRSATPVQSPQSELPDLMEAFWGDATGASENSGIGPARGRRSSGRSVAG